MPSPPSFGFGRQARLSSRREFSRVFAQGRKVAGRQLILWVFNRPPQPGEDVGRPEPRLGLSVSAKVGGAVRRNRLKRLTREAFRLSRRHLSPDSDVVVYLRPACRWGELKDAQRDFLELCRQARILH